MSDPYLDGVYRWWHLTGPSPELLAAEAEAGSAAPRPTVAGRPTLRVLAAQSLMSAAG
jgi:hypothetical protein